MVKKLLNKTKNDLNMNKEDLSMNKEVAKSMDTSREAEIQKAEQEIKAVYEEKKYARVGVVNEIDHEYIQDILSRSNFSVVRQMQTDKAYGVNYPAKYAYPITVEDLCTALKNCYCRHLIHELILRGNKDTMGTYLSREYNNREYHVIAKRTENSTLCIVTDGEAYDYMCWLETVDIETLKTYISWKPVSLMELAEKLCITIGM